MALPVSINKRGFTLIEVLVALVITMITMLGLFKLTEMSMMTNLKNLVRDEGVQVAQQVMNTLRSKPIYEISPEGVWSVNDLQNNLGYSAVTRDFRNFQVTYTIEVTVNSLSSDLLELDVTVSWPFRGTTYSHSISSMVRR